MKSYVALLVMVVLLGCIQGAKPSPITDAFNTIEHILNAVRMVEDGLDRLEPSHGMVLKICREVVGHSLTNLIHVQQSLHCVKLTVEQASSAEMALTAASTYLRTCKQTLNEAGENLLRPFGYTISNLDALTADNCRFARTNNQGGNNKHDH